MNWFTKQVPASALEARLVNGEHDAAIKYLNKYRANLPIKHEGVMMALTILALEEKS
jgi:hypothetical protein